VRPQAIGHRVEVAADVHMVRIMRGGAVLGEHERCWARQQTMTDEASIERRLNKIQPGPMRVQAYARSRPTGICPGNPRIPTRG
jgi:hypothetical protein